MNKFKNFFSGSDPSFDMDLENNKKENYENIEPPQASPEELLEMEKERAEADSVMKFKNIKIDNLKNALKSFLVIKTEEVEESSLNSIAYLYIFSSAFIIAYDFVDMPHFFKFRKLDSIPTKVVYESFLWLCIVELYLFLQQIKFSEITNKVYSQKESTENTTKIILNHLIKEMPFHFSQKEFIKNFAKYIDTSKDTKKYFKDTFEWVEQQVGNMEKNDINIFTYIEGLAFGNKLSEHKFDFTGKHDFVTKMRFKKSRKAITEKYNEAINRIRKDAALKKIEQRLNKLDNER